LHITNVNAKHEQGEHSKKLQKPTNTVVNKETLLKTYKAQLGSTYERIRPMSECLKVIVA